MGFIRTIISGVRKWFYRGLVPGHRYPLYLFRRFVCVYSGRWADIRLPHTWLVVSWKPKRKWAYLSKDGTPGQRTWSIGSRDW